MRFEELFVVQGFNLDGAVKFLVFPRLIDEAIYNILNGYEPFVINVELIVNRLLI